MRLSINQLSDLTGFDRRKISRRLADLEHEQGPKGAKMYASSSALRMLYAGMSEGLDSQQERAALDRVRREITELERDKKRGQLVPVSEVSTEWLNLISTIRAGMLAVPSRAAVELLGLTDEREIDDALTNHIHEAMQSIADSEQPG